MYIWLRSVDEANENNKENNMDRHNVFKEKTENELIVLYGQFLEFEKLGYIPNNSELGKIRDQYFEWYNAMMLLLLRAISDMWFQHLGGYLEE